MQNIVLMEQVHGNEVKVVGKKDIGNIVRGCDALISSDPSVLLGVRVADCLPISIKDKKGRAFGIIHAGWRGLDNGIIGKTIKLMSDKMKIDKCELEIVIGPHICQKHYEVGGEVALKFNDYPQALLQKDGKTFLDLAKVAVKQLVRAGVAKENIRVDKMCTFENKPLPSFRRDKTQNRLMIYTSFI